MHLRAEPVPKHSSFTLQQLLRHSDSPRLQQTPLVGLAQYSPR